MHSRLLEKSIVWLLLIVWGLIVLHAPLTVWLVAHGAPVYVKAWKEILMVVAGLMLIVHVARLKKISDIMASPFVWGCIAYGILHFVTALCVQTTAEAALAGLAIDLRYIFFFMLVYIMLRIHPEYRARFLRIGAIGAGVVVGFAVLQIFLPYDVLKYLGYSDKTIIPYLMVDNNAAYIRENSTLRGPNPLGAYAGSVAILIVAYMTAKRRVLQGTRRAAVLSGLLFLSVVALWMSYSRSALIAALVGIFCVLWVGFQGNLKRSHRVVLAVSIVALLGFGWLIRDTSFVHNVILHDNPTNGAGSTSNGEHLSSLRIGLSRMLAQPFGAGVGSTGSASLLADQGVIIENQYLMIAHEVGWLGLGIFIWLYYLVMTALWHRRSSWLGLGVWASGLALGLIGLVLPVWADDTVSIVWWGLAALVIAKEATYGTTSHKKTT